MTPSPYEDTLARRWERRRLTLAVLAVLAGIILAIWLGRVLTRRDRNYAKAEFKLLAAGSTDSLQRLVTDRVGKVSTTVAFIRSSDINDRKDFRTFVSQLMKNVTSIEMLAWAPRFQQRDGMPMKRRFAKKAFQSTRSANATTGDGLSPRENARSIIRSSLPNRPRKSNPCSGSTWDPMRRLGPRCAGPQLAVSRR